jgi:hypothetical protein
MNPNGNPPTIPLSQYQNQGQSPQPQEGFLQSLLPTLGGIGGGLLGGAIDVGTLGAATPFINPITMGIGGAALGSAGGKAIEHLTENQNPLQGDVLGAGVQGAIGQGTGDILGGIFGKIGSTLFKYGGEQAGKDLISKEFGNLTTPEAENLNLPNSINLAKEMGIPSSAKAFAEAPQLATGINGIAELGNKGVFNNVVDSSIASAHPNGVDLSGYRDAATEAINKRTILGTLEPTTSGAGGMPKPATQASAVMSNLERMMQQYGLGGQGAVGEGVQASSKGAMDLLRQMQGLQNTGGLSAAEKSVYKDMEGFLKSKIYTPEVDNLVAQTRVSPEDADLIRQASVKLTGSTDYGDAIVSKVNSATKASDLTNTQRQLIDMRDAGNVATSRNAAKAVLNAPQPNAVLDAAGHLVSGNKTALLGKILHGVQGVGGPIAQKTGALLDRMSPFTGDGSGILNKVLPAAGVAVATSPNVAGAAANNASLGGAMQPPQMGAPMASPGASPMSSPIQQSFETALRMMQVDPYLASSMGPILKSLAPQAQEVQGAATMLPSSLQGYQAAGGGQGLIPGLWANLGALLTGGPAATSQAQGGQLNQQLRTLGLPSGAIGPAQIKALLSLMQGGGLLSTVPAQ